MERKQLDTVYLSKGEIYEVFLLNGTEILKQISFEFLQKADKDKIKKVMTQFKEEKRILKNLKIKGTPKLLDEGEEFLLSSYIEGITLKEYVQKKDIKEKEIYDIIFKLLQIVREVHEKEIIHCDIKPENIIITYPQCNIKSENPQKIYPDVSLIDFGSSMLNGSRGELIQGTKPYSAPELYSLYKIKNYSTDIYSIFKVIEYLLNTKKIKLPKEFSSFFKMGLAQNINERYKTVDEVMNAWRIATNRFKKIKERGY